jgi:hypothetical protein
MLGLARRPSFRVAFLVAALCVLLEEVPCATRPFRLVVRPAAGLDHARLDARRLRGRRARERSLRPLQRAAGRQHRASAADPARAAGDVERPSAPCGSRRTARTPCCRRTRAATSSSSSIPCRPTAARRRPRSAASPRRTPTSSRISSCSPIRPRSHAAQLPGPRCRGRPAGLPGLARRDLGLLHGGRLGGRAGRALPLPARAHAARAARLIQARRPAPRGVG